MHHYMLGTNCLETSFTGNDLGLLVDNEHDPAECSHSEMANSLLGWVRQSISSMEVILPLCSALLKAQCKRDRDLLE